jgi:hypothetical protein
MKLTFLDPYPNFTKKARPTDMCSYSRLYPNDG